MRRCSTADARRVDAHRGRGDGRGKSAVDGWMSEKNIFAGTETDERRDDETVD